VVRLRVEVLEVPGLAVELGRARRPDVEATPGVALVREPVVVVGRPVAAAEVLAAALLDVGEVDGVRAPVVGLRALRSNKSEQSDDPATAAKDAADVAALDRLG